MKKIFLLLLALPFALMSRAQILPVFSTAEDPVYYFVQFKTGSACLADQGSGNKLLTATKSNVDAQKWAFIGTKDNFTLLSKAGNYVSYNGSRYITSDTPAEMKLISSTYSGAADCWELQRASGSQSMNQWGGAGSGKELGEWSAGDANNPVSLILASAVLPEFSDDVNETYYFLQFCEGSGTLADMGAGLATQVASVNPVDGQLWKLVGNKSNFQLKNKAGRYAYVDGSGNNARIKTRSEADDNGFSLYETGYSAYSPNWEIHANGVSDKNAFNQWQGASVGHQIGLWSADDKNNPISFVKADDMSYDDFKVEGISGYVPEHPQTLWYTQPATLGGTSNNWMEYSLPIGNGQLGASLFGGVQKDEIQFNEKTVWSGTNALSSYGGGGYGKYQNFGSVFAEYIGDDGFSYGTDHPVKDYLRQLDLSTATGLVTFKSPDGAVTYKREYIASYPDQAIVAHYTASEAGKISLRFTLKANTTGIVAKTSYSDGTAYFHQKLDLVTYDARLKVVPTGGEMTTSSDGIEVVGADEVLVVLAGGTNFDIDNSSYISNTAYLPSNMRKHAEAVAEKGWEAIYADHVADFQSYFNRVDLQFEGAENKLPTNELVDIYSKTGASAYTANTLMLEKLYFDYGRYLEMSSSRGVDLPSNLQGIWNNNPSPPWNSDIHANINVQMNYWPAEPTNLSDMHLPFLNYIVKLATKHKEWKSYATRAGQTVGWTFYTENNIFGGGSPWSDNYTIANAWYVTHLWQHYRYTLDKDFLLEAFPAMWSCSQYWMERMVEASDGSYECPKEYSPEHGPSAENATAHSQQLVVELFRNTMDAAKALGEDSGLSEENLERLQTYIDKSDKGLAIETYTGNWGTSLLSSGSEILREWKYSSYTVGENAHRHQSHLMCLYPFAQVTPSSPYFKAAVNSLKLRTDNSTGWSMGWRINLWARAQDGDHAHVLLHSALKHSTSYATDQSRGGIYYNLYDSHAPFQIDGNFGACAGIAEMLMQSATDTIQILPALPKVWKTGSVKGLKAVGNFTVSIDWKEGKAVQVDITSHKGQPLVVNCAGIADAKFYVNDAAANVVLTGDNIAAIEAKEGDKIVVSLDGSYEPTGVSNSKTDAMTAVSVENRTVTIKGTGVRSASIYDLQGRKILTTKKTTFRVPAAAGNIAVLQLTAADGTKSSMKLTL